MSKERQEFFDWARIRRPLYLVTEAVLQVMVRAYMWADIDMVSGKIRLKQIIEGIKNPSYVCAD